MTRLSETVSWGLVGDIGQLVVGASRSVVGVSRSVVQLRLRNLESSLDATVVPNVVAYL